VYKTLQPKIKFFRKTRKCHNYCALYFFIDEWVQVQWHCLPGWGLVAAEWVLSLLLPCRGSGVHEGDVCPPLVLQPHKSSWAMLSAVLDERKIDLPLCLSFRDIISPPLDCCMSLFMIWICCLVLTIWYYFFLINMHVSFPKSTYLAFPNSRPVLLLSSNLATRKFLKIFLSIEGMAGKTSCVWSLGQTNV